MKTRLLLVIAAIVVPSFAHAKLFQNSYVKFELPDNWQCNMEQTEWICRSVDKSSAREAIVILTAKEVGPLDTLTEYESYLKKPKVAVDAKGQSITAQIKQIQRRSVKNHEWVDGLLLGSEIPNFYTRYLATTKSRVAVLVTFTAHQRFYTKYSKDFFNAISSLEVLASDALLNQRSLAPLGSDSSLLGYNVGGVIPQDMLAEADCIDGEDCGGTESGDFGDTALALVFLILAIGAYLVLRKKK
jgi:hypothetical protein